MSSSARFHPVILVSLLMAVVAVLVVMLLVVPSLHRETTDRHLENTEGTPPPIILRGIEKMEGAFRTLKSLPVGPSVLSWDPRVLVGLSEDQVKTRLSMIPGMDPGLVTDAREIALIRRWAALNPKAACDYAYRAVLCGADEAVLREAVSVWSAKDSPAAIAWAAAVASPGLRDLAVSTASGVWASRNPAIATESLRSLTNAAVRASAWMGIAQAIAGSDDQKTLARALALPGPLREKALAQIFGPWFKRDPSAAAEWLLSQPVEIQLPLTGRLASEWARRDPQSALAWSGAASPVILNSPQIPSGPVQRRAMDAALSSFVSSDPERAAAWMTSGQGKPYFSQRVGSIASSWASIDPVAAAAWASSIKNGGSRDAAISSIAATWTRADPSESLGWIKGIRGSSDRNTALASFGRTLASTDPDGAAYWSSQISDNKLREETVSKVVSTWKTLNAAAAEQFVRSNPSAAFLRKKP